MRDIRKRFAFIGVYQFRTMQSDFSAPDGRSIEHGGISLGDKEINSFKNRGLPAVVLSDEQIDPLQTA